MMPGWSVTVVAAVFLLAVRGADSALAMVAGVLPALVFWGLDAYYLQQERLCRTLYDHVRKTNPRTLTTDSRWTPADSRRTCRAGGQRSGPPPSSGSTSPSLQLS